MRTTVTLDEELVAKAATLTGIEEHSALVRAALETLVRVENGRLLATLGVPNLNPRQLCGTKINKCL